MDHPISSDTVDDGAVRRSQRIRPLTQKAEENALQEMKQTFWIHHGKFAINLNEVEIQLSGDCDDDTLETMQSDLKKGYREIEAIYDEIKVRSIASPDQEIRLGIDRVKADTDLLVNAIQLKNMADDKDTRHSVSDRSKQTSRRSNMSSRHSNISDTSSKIRDAKANAAARKIEMIAQKEQLEREEELDEIQKVLNRKRRELEHQRLSVLLRVEEAKLHVYEETQRENMKRGVLGSGSQLYSTINKRQEVHISAPLHQENPEIVERQMTSPKSEVMLIAEAIVGVLNKREDVDTINFSCRNTVTEVKPMKPCNRQHAHRKEVRCVVMPNDSEIKFEKVHPIMIPEQVSLQCIEHFSYRIVGRITILQQEIEGTRNREEVNANSAAKETAASTKMTYSVGFKEEFASRLTLASRLTDDPTKGGCIIQDGLSTTTTENDVNCSTRLQSNMKQRNRNVAFRRYRHLKRRFKPEERYFRDDRKFTDDTLEYGNASTIPPDELSNNYTRYDVKLKRRRCDLNDPGRTEEMVQIIC